MDVNESFIPPARQEFAKNTTYNGRWKLDLGELPKLKYDAQSFNFLLCQGVIHHIEDDQKGLEEIYRVLRPGGMAHIMVGGERGLINRFWMETARQEYRSNPVLKKLIDSPNCLKEIENKFSNIITKIENDGSNAYLNSIKLLEVLMCLMDEDLILSFQDSLKAPIYKTYTLKAFEDMLQCAGFSQCKRVYRTPSFGNVRKIFAPM